MTVTIQAPTLEESILQQTAEHYINAGDGSYFYWLYKSPGEGLKAYRANTETIPVLNDNHPAWKTLEPIEYFNQLHEAGVSGAQEKAYLTDAYCAAYGRSYGEGHGYFGWEESVETIQSQSILFPV